MQVLLRVPPSLTNLLSAPVAWVLCSSVCKQWEKGMSFLGGPSECQLSCWAKFSSVFFLRSLLRIFHACQCPLSFRRGRWQRQHPNLLTRVTYRLWWSVTAAPATPTLPQLPWHWRHSPGFLFWKKNLCGANTFFCSNLAWPSPSLLACSSTHLPTKRLINVYFYSCFHMVCSQAFACVCVNAHLHWLLWGNCSTNAGHLQINACTQQQKVPQM